jgi:hypothetical protein
MLKAHLASNDPDSRSKNMGRKITVKKGGSQRTRLGGAIWSDLDRLIGPSGSPAHQTIEI